MESSTTKDDRTEDMEIEDSDPLDTHSDLPSFDIWLAPTGDAGSSYRTENDPSAPFQRNNYIERRGAVDMRCSCLDVVHGLFSADGDDFATLIVLDFRFDPRKNARRFKSVDISLQFSGMGGTADGAPEVFAIAPYGTRAQVTTQHEETKRSANIQIGGAAPVGGLTATGTLGWEKTVSRDTNDQTTVMGFIDLRDRSWGKSNCAAWTLLENNTTKSGAPRSMRTAILLKRQDENPFQCVVKIDANVDVKSQMERMFGRVPKDDPVLFNPEADPTNKLQNYNVEDLGATELDNIWAIATVVGAIP
jgi:hypothetical protein